MRDRVRERLGSAGRRKGNEAEWMVKLLEEPPSGVTCHSIPHREAVPRRARKSEEAESGCRSRLGDRRNRKVGLEAARLLSWEI